MKDKLITEIQLSVAHLLNNVQLEELRRVLTNVFHGVDIAEKKAPEATEAKENGGLKDLFIAAKKIKGCS